MLIVQLVLSSTLTPDRHQMVGVINPNETRSPDKQIEAARAADFEVAPGGKIPSEATANVAAPESAALGTPPSPHQNDGQGLPQGAIVGMTIAGVVGSVAVIACFVYRARRRRKAPPIAELEN
jgi:hypothetical protein